MGWENVFHCEISEFPRKVLEYWYPNSVSYEDITTTDFTSWRGKVDILTGGFPCQPFSVAGKRLGAEDDRYLWPHMLRAIREIQSTWVVGENVVGLTTMVQPSEEVEVGGQASLFEENYRTREEQTYTIEDICQGLEQAGYSVQPFVIPACAVGAPHRRDRIWIVAHRTGTRTESLQQGGQNGVHESEFTPNTDIYRQRGRENKQICEQRREETPDARACCKDGPTSYAQCIGSGKMDNEVHPQLADGARIDDNGVFRTSLNANSDGLQYGNNNGEQDTQLRHRFKELYSKTGWTNFPTQSPVCGRDDGLSLGLVDITFPKWRTECVKALGNAIVPQVIYEIFKAIEEHERETTERL
ncbi:DNA cytosine methyltransferase [Hoylesella loescheii]|uniref:DNA cytosine methyltransferase n=1 Tax=Hoylesella loescheii TaxID=840 RepID=UPI0031F1B844